MRHIIRNRTALFAMDCPEILDLAEINSPDVLEKKLSHQKLEAESLLKGLQGKVVTTEKIIKDYQNNLQSWEKLLESLNIKADIEGIFTFSDSKNFLNALDTSIRVRMFWLAAHYWEASWLMEASSWGKRKANRKGREKYWQVQAMLTPCFVTTLYAGPSFFWFQDSSQHIVTLQDFIDLLIIDEAGQTLPSVAGGMVSIAKKLLIVGDDKQIQPISKLTAGIDIANAKKFGLCRNVKEFDLLKEKGILNSLDFQTGRSFGNLITLGQNHSKFHFEELSVPGLMLREHRRCAKKIISYCNELAYDGQLIPLTVEDKTPFPNMGYAHIKGQAEPVGTSRKNEIEAKTIVKWVAKNYQIILDSCPGKTLDDCLGIITPFYQQGRLLERLLREAGLDVKKVGTVHSLQGSEKPYIIFSPVYTLDADGRGVNCFFDRSESMLNVAVSRAQRSFLVFGDMEVFDPKGSLPSSLLARYLFASPDNEIVDISVPELKEHSSEKVWQVNTLSGHLDLLRKSFDKAINVLHIVSPYISINALKEPDICVLIDRFKHKEIHIYVDKNLSMKQVGFNEAINQLKEAGAIVHFVERVHSKVIAIDESFLVLGSFNWLSASRDPDSKYSNIESSIGYFGSNVGRYIQRILAPIKNRILIDKVY